MIPTLTRLLKGSLKSGTSGRRHPGLQDLQAIRVALLRCIDDCDNVQTLRLRHKIESAKSVQELWLLRNDAYQLVSQRHTQTVAAERINALVGLFQGWVDPRQLTRIG